MTKSTLVQIVIVSGRYEIWRCLLSHLVGCLYYKKDAAEFSKVFIAIGNRDIERCILSQSKSTESKIFLGVLTPDPLSPTYYSIAPLATRADN